MNLKSLSLTVLILAILSTIVAWMTRPAAPIDMDPRVGQPLVEGSLVNAATGFTITSSNQSIELDRSEEGNWQVVSYHRLPADEDKLRRLVQEVNEATIERVVTRNPERAARLDLGSASLTFESPEESVTLTMGRTAERGGRYLRYGDAEDAPVYLTGLSTFLDTTAKNWADSALTDFEADDVQSVTVTFAEAAPLTVARAEAEADWELDEAPEGRRLRVSAITSLLSTLSGLRFSETAEPDSTEAKEAAAHARRIELTTFDDEAIVVSLGRRPEQIVPRTPAEDPAEALADLTSTDSLEPESAEEILEDMTETIPAGPVFVALTGPASRLPLALVEEPLAFQVSDYIFTGLPADHDALLEDLPEPEPAPSPEEASAESP